uniref:Uncharacterized protein n=1 Tax=Micrurus paraensis TaxID=1970185 RepID=A0A2D4L3Y9_9SAUR
MSVCWWREPVFWTKQGFRNRTIERTSSQRFLYRTQSDAKRDEVNRKKHLLVAPLFGYISLTRSPGKKENETAEREAQKRDIQRQKGEKASNARSPSASHNCGASHLGCGGAFDCGVRLRGHSPQYN